MDCLTDGSFKGICLSCSSSSCATRKSRHNANVTSSLTSKIIVEITRDTHGEGSYFGLFLGLDLSHGSLFSSRLLQIH